MNINNFKSYVVGGFTIVGWKTINGYTLGPDKGSDDYVRELPKEVELNGIVYELEHVEVFDTGYFNAEYC